MAGPWEAYQESAPAGPWAKYTDANAKPAMGNAVSDIVPEIKHAASENWDAINQGLLHNPQKSAIGGLLDTGRGLLAIPGLIASPITGAARSILGHGLAATEHAIGGAVNPEIAAKDNPQEMYDNAKEGVDKAMMAVAPRGASPTAPRLGPAPKPTAIDLKNDARSVWNDPAIKNTPIPVADASALASSAENDLLQRGFRPSNGSAPGTFDEVKRMTPPQGVQSVSVDDMRAARRALNMRAGERDLTGKATPEAVAARSVIEKIDTLLDNVSPQLREANANYSAGKAADLLDYRSMKAEHRAAKTGSGSNIENTMRQEVDKIPDRGLTAEQRMMRDSIVEGTLGRNALRKVGKLGFSDGLSIMYHGALALPTAGTSTAIGTAATLARKYGEHLTRKQIGNLNESIRDRAPLAQALAANPRPIPISNKTKALASALMGQNIGLRQMSLVPAHAEERQ